MDIPQEVQDKLKCSECDKFLSCGPIFVLHRTGRAICGRCSLETEDLIDYTERTRIGPYEATASLLSFPCAFTSHGCPEKLPFSLGPQPHESSCKFRPYICPITQNCDWRGPWPELKQHCEETHPEKILENPCNPPQPDLTTSNLQSYLVPTFNFIFLVQLKICLTSGKMYHSVRMYGDSNFLDKFSFKLHAEGNNIKFARSGSVLRPGIQSIEEPTVVCTTINCLSEIFSANESKLTLRIQALFKYCANCFSEIENEDSTFCDDCTRKLTKCQFHDKGCLFEDIHEKKREKHELFYCKYQTKCECGADFAGGTYCDHMESSSSCRKTSKANIDCAFRLTRNIDNNKKIILFSSKDLGTVVCGYKLLNNLLTLRVFTPLTSYELKDLKCLVRLTDPLSKFSRCLTPKLLDESESWDWYVHEDMDGFASWRQHGTDIKISIVKK